MGISGHFTAITLNGPHIYHYAIICQLLCSIRAILANTSLTAHFQYDFIKDLKTKFDVTKSNSLKQLVLVYSWGR